MIVTIWRHGSAEEGVNDRLRNLTSIGRADVGYGCRQFQQACKLRDLSPLTTILHSPWVRTTQTADIIASAFSAARITPEAALRPGSTLSAVDTVLSTLGTHGAVQHAVLVSHQPLVSQLVDHWLGDVSRVPSLPPGGLVTLSFEVAAPACATLLFWSFPPAYEASV
jgi:phosphohistidine phosphatase